MKSTTLVIALIGASSAIATAQPDPGTGTTDITPTPPPTPPSPPRAPQPPLEPPPPTMHPAPVVAPAPVIDHDRPTEIAFAIGLGYIRPAGGSFDLQNPNAASVRLRLLSGLTIEPTVTIASTSNENDTAGTGMTTMTDTISEFQLGALIRLPVIKHGRVDFELLGNVNLDVLKDDPDGDYNTKTTTILDLGWGVGIAYWLSHHWQLSTSATNPFVTYSSTSTQTSQDTSTKTSATTFGITFNPTIYVMIHLYN